MSYKRNSLLATLSLWGSAEPSFADTGPRAGISSRPKYLNTPKHPGTTIPRTEYVPKRRSSSTSTLGKRLRCAKVFTSFPRISDDTPSNSPPKSEGSMENAMPAAALQLDTIPKDSQVEALKSPPPSPTLPSLTSSRQAFRRKGRALGEITQTETVDIRPSLVPNSPTRYVYNSMDSPPSTPGSDTSEPYGFFFDVVSNAGNRLSRSFTTTTAPTSVSSPPRGEKLTRDAVKFHDTMKQKTANPELSWDGTGQPMPKAEEDRMRRQDLEKFKAYTRALAAARWTERNAAMAAEKAELKAQGKLSFEELCARAPSLIEQRGWVFNPGFVHEAQRLAQELAAPPRRIQRVVGDSMKRILADGTAMRAQVVKDAPKAAEMACLRPRSYTNSTCEEIIDWIYQGSLSAKGVPW